jgi:hypothetical protein
MRVCTWEIRGCRPKPRRRCSADRERACCHPPGIANENDFTRRCKCRQTGIALCSSGMKETPEKKTTDNILLDGFQCIWDLDRVMIYSDAKGCLSEIMSRSGSHSHQGEPRRTFAGESRIPARIDDETYLRPAEGRWSTS